MKIGDGKVVAVQNRTPHSWFVVVERGSERYLCKYIPEDGDMWAPIVGDTVNVVKDGNHFTIGRE